MKEEMVYKEEWLNPDSPKYYKGFRYVKYEDGDDVWYDENDVCRKEIIYYDNGNKYYEVYFNEKGEWHNEEGYAYQEWDIKGKLKFQYHIINGKELTEQEWKEKTTKEETKTFKLTYDELFSLLKESYRNGYSIHEMVEAGLERYDADEYARWVLLGLK